MKVTYEFHATCLCPVAPVRDYYAVTVYSETVIPVEGLLAAAERCNHERRFQEDYTVMLAEEIKAKGWTHFSVITSGYHSGVKTTVEA